MYFQVTNFVRATAAEGSGEHLNEDNEKNGKMDAVTCSLSQADVRDLLSKACSNVSATDSMSGLGEREADEPRFNRRLAEATSTAARLLELQRGSHEAADAQTPCRKAATDRCRPLYRETKKAVEANAERMADMAATKTYASNWEQRYEVWLKNLMADPGKRPYHAQQIILELVHHRCVLEHDIEGADENAAMLQAEAPAPLFRLVHGLPGSGKSQILKWLRSYFIEVWVWEDGIHFQFVAPLNTMADNIGGSTVHSWSEVVWEDKRGRKRKPHGGTEDNISTMAVKCNCLRFLFMDEIECCGLDLIGDVEEATRKNTGRLYKFAKDDTYARVFGGLNVFLLGDFCQLPPTGQIPIMSNPHSKALIECAKASSAMMMFWHGEHRETLQTWQHNEQRVLHLDVNKRSGNDSWFSNLLDSCREGAMSEADYNFLHGFPTDCKAVGSCSHNKCRDFENAMKECIRDAKTPWLDHWRKIQDDFQCPDCKDERLRRTRVLGCERFGGLSKDRAQLILKTDRFADCVFITECNKPVCLYGMVRAQEFARIKNEQLLWIQSEDTPPSEHFASHSKEELMELKKKWNHPNYHARKTEGIPSLLPLVYDMTWRLRGGQGAHFKDCGIHTGSAGRVRAWTLHAEDEKLLKESSDHEFVLKHLPLVVWLESEQDLRKQHPDAPKKNWFPMRPITNAWTLDAAAFIEIARKGFAAVPDFSCTIHNATGRSLKAVLPDLGGLPEPASFSASMRGSNEM